MLNRWQKTVVDTKGNIMPGAVLMIRRESDQALVTVYKDRAGTQAYPMGQVTADSMGYAYFYAPADLYRITSAAPAIDWRDVDIGAAAAQQIAQQALDSALPTYETVAEMDADTSQDVPTLGRVVNDADPDNNGYYMWDGVAWSRSSYQPASDADVQARLRRDQNLADLDDAATARTNLGLGSAAVEDSSNFALSATKVEGGDGLAGGGDLSTDRIITLSGQTKYDLDQIYAQIRRAEYGDGPYPVFDQVFGAGASFLDPRITHTRPGKSWRIVNGVLREYDVNEPCLTDDGWSVRPAETNLTTESSDLGLFAPAAGGVLFEPSAVPGPALGTTMMKIIVANTSGLHRIQGHTGFAIKPSTKYTATIYAKAGEAGYLFINFVAALGLSGAINLLTGEVISGTVSPVVTHLRDGIYRIDLTGVSPVSPAYSTYIQIQESFAVGDQYYQGDGVSSLYVSDIQINEGDPIPYIPTTDSAVTRAADNVSIQGDGFASVYNPMEGAYIFDGDLALADGWMHRIVSSDDTGLQLSVGADGSVGLLARTSGSTTDSVYTASGHGADGKFGITWESDGAYLWARDVQYGPIAVDMSQADRFLFATDTALKWHEYRRLTIFNRRPSDAMLEALIS